MQGWELVRLNQAQIAENTGENTRLLDGGASVCAVLSVLGLFPLLGCYFNTEVTEPTEDTDSLVPELPILCVFEVR